MSEPQRQHPTEPDRIKLEDDESGASLVSSIKTSIDDETLMELAKKGIQAMTPVNNNKMRPHRALSLSRTQENFTEEQKNFALKQPEVHLSGKTA